MTREICKYVLRATDRQVVSMPEGAELLHVDVQRGELCLWARVWPGAQKVRRSIRIAGTGHEIHGAEATAPHVGSALMHEGALVCHVFDLGELED